MTTLTFDVQVRRGALELDVRTALEAGHAGLFGPSGAGKTTLLHVLAGLLRPDGGRIELNGEVLFDARAGVLRPPHVRGIGLVFQDGRLFPHLSVRKNLLYGQRRQQRTGRRLALDTIVTLLELGPMLERRTRHLSGGERQRVALGRTLLSGPKLLLLDEPLAGLDRRLRRQIIPFLQRIRDDLSIPMLYVSHDLGELLQITDRLLVLDTGRLVAEGNYADLAQQSAALEVLHPMGLVNVVRAPLGGLEAAGEQTVLIRAEDVALWLEQVRTISIQNQLPGRVSRLIEHGGRVLVEIELDDRQKLLAEITLRALNQLELAPGRRVWCLVKTSAMQRVRP